MLHTATINYNSPTHLVPPALGIIHPSNVTNVNGRIISRSPTAYQIQDQRNLSPNKLNATKKPLIGQNNANFNNTSNFINRNRNSPSPNTKPTNQLGNFISQGHQNFHQNLNFNTNNGKPLLNSKGFSPRGIEQQAYNANHYEKTIYCQNHFNKLAQFFAETQAEDIGYCQKCALNLINNGFPVSRRQGRIQHQNIQITKPTIFQQYQLEPFKIPQYMGTQEYFEVQKFISQIDGIHHLYLTQISRYQNMEQHYEHQYQITQKFYQSLLDLVSQMKNDHLADLNNQCKKHVQLALIKQDLLKQDLEQIQIIRSDLILHSQTIMQEFHKDVIQQSFAFYRQQIFRYKDKIQDENVQFDKQIINQNQPQLKKRLKKIQEYLLNVWNDKQQPINKPQNIQNIVKNIPKALQNNKNFANPKQIQDKSTKTVKQLIQMNAKIQADSKKQKQTTACRKLFEDENDTFGPDRINNNQFQHDINQLNNHEELIGQKSPQFKNI